MPKNSPQLESTQLDFVISVNRLLKAAEETRAHRDRLLALIGKADNKTDPRKPEPAK